MPEPQAAELLEPASHRLVRSVDGMTAAQWTEPSTLPGWTRAHLVAHLALNAEALVAALEGIRGGLRTPMYPSQEARDADIAALGGRPSGEIRDRFLGSITVIHDSIADLADNIAEASFPRVPGSSSMVRAGDVADMRLREIEIHHVDLGLGYAAADWPAAFPARLLEARAAAYEGAGFTAYAEDLDRRWRFAGGGPTVSGTAAALAWWATGRGLGEGLTSDDDTVPRIGPW